MQERQNNVDAGRLAVCLRDKGFVMYGRAGCSACAIEKEYFGEAFADVTYIDCSAIENQAVCQEKNIKAYPTWEDIDGKQYRGAIPLATLAEISGCSEEASLEQKEATGAGTLGSLFSEYGLIFLAGVISFFAPCVIPLFPTYLSIISGYTFAELYGLEFSRIRGRILKSVLFFVLGFSLVFTLLGASGSIIGQFISSQMPILLKFSGVIMIFLGLVQLRIIKIPSWEFDYAWAVQRRLSKLGNLTAGIVGVTSALCWIPCIGPILAGILVLSANSLSVLKGMSYLLVYSLGVMLPFFLAGLFFPRFFDIYREKREILKWFSWVSGIIIILFGLVLMSNKYADFINFYYSLLKYWPIKWPVEKLIGR